MARGPSGPLAWPVVVSALPLVRAYGDEWREPSFFRRQAPGRAHTRPCMWTRHSFGEMRLCVGIHALSLHSLACGVGNRHMPSTCSFRQVTRFMGRSFRGHCIRSPASHIGPNLSTAASPWQRRGCLRPGGWQRLEMRRPSDRHALPGAAVPNMSRHGLVRRQAATNETPRSAIQVCIGIRSPSRGKHVVGGALGQFRQQQPSAVAHGPRFRCGCDCHHDGTSGPVAKHRASLFVQGGWVVSGLDRLVTTSRPVMSLSSASGCCVLSVGRGISTASVRLRLCCRGA